MDFRSKQITVTMSGEQWFALFAKLAGKPLSEIGRQYQREAAKILGDTLTKASK